MKESYIGKMLSKELEGKTDRINFTPHVKFVELNQAEIWCIAEALRVYAELHPHQGFAHEGTSTQAEELMENFQHPINNRTND